MNPWEYKEPTYTEQFILQQWAKLKPSDFCFSICECSIATLPKETNTTTYIAITPIDFFTANKKMLNESIPITHLLPIYLVEEERSVFATHKAKIDVYEDMLVKGFRHSSAFQNFIDTTHYTDR